ncbi:MAG: DUF1027 domain-containing protein [Bacilli bacterium]|nr:DUF1027 domain-containing protein [Bacilli bacterium]
MKTIELQNNKYELIRNDKDCFNYEDIKEKVTDYFEDYDYILGDFSYDKVRLKGYYESTNKKATKINDIKYIDDYIENYCSFGARVFVLKKIK